MLSHEGELSTPREAEPCPGAVREIQQTKGESRIFLVSLLQDLSPLVILVTGAGKHGYYLRDLKVKWRHVSRSPDVPASWARGSRQGQGPLRPLRLTHTSPPWVQPSYPTLSGWIPSSVVLSTAWESFSCRTWWHQEPQVGCDHPSWRSWQSERFETLQ